jgi:SAM-dependent methyltransferase
MRLLPVPERDGVTAAVGERNQAAREEWLERTLRRIPAGGRILDAGAGERQYERFCRHLVYVAQDFSGYDGEGDGKGLHPGEWDRSRLDIVCDIVAVPEPDASFDAVLCVEVLEHLPDPLPAIREMARLLRPGGHLVLTAPFCSLTHFSPFHFTTGFNRYYFERHLPECGFSIAEIEPNGNYFEFAAQELRRVPEVARKYGGGGPTIPERIAARLLLRMLARFSAAGDGSRELACFGYHVLARKGEPAG